MKRQPCASEGTAMTTSHRMLKFKHRIHPQAPARIRGQATVAAFQRANSLQQPEKQAYSQLQQLFSPSFSSSKISLPIQQDKFLKDEIKTKQTQSKIPPPPPPTKQHKLISSREKKNRLTQQGSYSEIIQATYLPINTFSRVNTIILWVMKK